MNAKPISVTQPSQQPPRIRQRMGGGCGGGVQGFGGGLAGCRCGRVGQGSGGDGGVMVLVGEKTARVTGLVLHGVDWHCPSALF